MGDVHFGQPDSTVRSTGGRRPGPGDVAWLDDAWSRRLDAVSSAVQATHRLWHKRYDRKAGGYRCGLYNCPFVGWLCDHLHG